MRKVRANALWNELSPEQLQTLDTWLFDEKLGYTEILPRAQKELGFKGSMGSLKRYYARRCQERTLLEFEELRDDLAELNEAPADANALRSAAMKLLAAYVFQQARQAPEKAKEWGSVAKLIVDNDRNEARREVEREEHQLRRELKAEDHKIRREAMAFAKEKFEFRTMEVALKALPQLQELAEAKMDPHTKRYVENAHWNLVRRTMFGPGSEVQPENAQEEAEMAAAKREREARRQREIQRERDKVSDVQPPTPSSKYYKEYVERMAKREEEYWQMSGEYEI